MRGALEISARVERRSGIIQSSSARSRAAPLDIAEPSAEPSTPSTNPNQPEEDFFPLLVLPISPLTDPQATAGRPLRASRRHSLSLGNHAPRRTDSGQGRVRAGRRARGAREPRRDGVRAGAPPAPTPSNPATGCPAMCFFGSRTAPTGVASARARATDHPLDRRPCVRGDVSPRVQTAPRREASGPRARTHAARISLKPAQLCAARVRTRRRATIRGEGPRRVARARCDPPARVARGAAAACGVRLRRRARRRGRSRSARRPARVSRVAFNGSTTERGALRVSGFPSG